MSATAATTRAHVFHADLSDALPDHDYVLIAPGGPYQLAAHTPQSKALLSASASNDVKLSARLNAATHYTANAVMLSTDQAWRVHIKAVPGDSSKPSYVHAGTMAIPNCTHVAAEANGALHAPIDWVSTAQLLIFHHPDLQTPDPDVSGQVWDHLSPRTAPANYQMIEQLALQMRLAGPPTTDPDVGWATLVPIKDNRGQTLHLQNPTPAIQNDAGDAMTAVMISSKNDVRLKNKKWMFTDGVSVEDGAKNVLQLAAAIRTTTTGDSWVATVDNLNTVSGMKTEVTPLDPSKRKVKIHFENSYVRYLGAYIQFLDADMKPMKTPDWKPDAGDSFFTTETQYDDFRGLGTIAPINTFMAIPIAADPGVLDVEVTFPEGAVAAGVFGCGLGTGALPYPRANLYGGIMTGLANLAIPSFMLGFGVARQSYLPLYKALKNPTVVKFMIGAAVIYFGASFTRTGVVNKRFDWSAFSSLASLIFNIALTEVLVWVEEGLVEQKLAEAIPFAGWLVLVLNISTGLAQLAQTIVEVATSPWNIPNRLSTTIETKVKILPDPQRHVFPPAPEGKKRSCTVKMIFQANKPTVVTTLTDIGDKIELDTSFANQLGGRVKFEVDFYVDTWLAAQATTGWLPNNEESAAKITLALLDNPVPINEKSVYTHARILTYQDPKYQWMQSGKAPTTTRANSDASQSGNAISIWQGLSLSQRWALLGWAWKAAGMGIPSSSGTTGTQLFAMQGLDIPGMSSTDRSLFPKVGFDSPNNIIYDPYPPRFKKDDKGQWVIVNGYPVPDPNDIDLGSYWVDPRKATLNVDAGGGYHLRKFDFRTGFNTSDNQPSYGRFPFPPDSLVIHPTGHVVAVNTQFAKIMVLQLETGNGKADNNLPLAQAFAGHGVNFQGSNGRAGLLVNPVAVTCSYDGTILILEWVMSENIKVARIQAFDINGNPVNAFKGSPFLEISTAPTYLDITAAGNQDLAYIYVLSYNGQGRAATDYNMAIYQYGTKATAANPLVTTNAVSAARIATDMWHSIYALNWEMTTDGKGNKAGPKGGTGTGEAGRTVPSISLWLPPIPS